MSGSNVTFNNTKGKSAYYATLPLANDAFIAILAKVVEGDSTLKDRTSISGVTSNGTTESDATSYVRKTMASVTVTVDNTADTNSISAANITWTALGGATNNTLVKFIVGYDDDTTSGTDANILGISAHSFDVTTNGTDLTAAITNLIVIS